MFIKKCAVALCLATAVSISANEQVKTDQNAEIKPLSLKDVIKKAIQTHPQVKKGQHAQAAARYDIKAAKSGYLPSLDLRAATGWEKVTNTSVINEGDMYRTLNRQESSLTLRQMLFDGFQTSSRVRRSNLLLSRAENETSDNKLSVALRASEAFLEVLRIREQLTLAQENVNAHQEILKLVEKRFENNMGRQADVIQVKGRLALAQAQLKREAAAQKGVNERYFEVVGEFPKTLAAPSDFKTELPKDLINAKVTALSTHPALKASADTVLATGASINEAKSAYMPRVDLELSGNENWNLGGTRGNDDTLMAMFVVNYNIFRGFGDKSAIMSLTEQREQQKEEMLELKRNIIRDLAVAWHARDGKLVELSYFIQHMISSEKTLKAYKAQYEIGQRTLFDLLNSRSEFFRSKATVIDTKYTNILSVYQILANTGELVDKVLK